MAQLRPYIFIDTCSLLDSCWIRRKGTDEYRYSGEKDKRFWGSEFISLVSMGEVIIPKRNYDELLRLCSRKTVSERAKFVLDRLKKLQETREIQIVGDSNDPFADAIMLSVALKFKMQRNLAFITQDHNLAADLEAIRHFESLIDHSKYDLYDIKIRRIHNKTGEIEPWIGLDKALVERYGRNERGKYSSSSAKNEAHVLSSCEGPSTGKSWWER